MLSSSICAGQDEEVKAKNKEQHKPTVALGTIQSLACCGRCIKPVLGIAAGVYLLGLILFIPIQMIAFLVRVWLHARSLWPICHHSSHTLANAEDFALCSCTSYLLAT